MNDILNACLARCRALTRPQRQGALLGLLVVVMVAVYARALRPSTRPIAPAPDQPQAPASAAAGVAPQLTAKPEEGSPDLAALRETQQREADRLKWNRDPFIKAAAAGGISGLTLSGILWDTVEPIAIINGRMLRVGEELEGYRVVEITPDRVSLSDGDQQFRLAISP